MSTPHIHVLATGGTIAGQAGSPTRADYRPGQIPIEDFLTRVDAFGLNARLTGEQVANIGSEDIDAGLWRRLHARIMASLDDPDCDGVIVTHGTDTAEETAFLLDQTLPTHKPVVLVGAMRPADAVGSDGLRNFANAVVTAADPGAAGRGVLVVMGDLIHSARDVRKAMTSGTNAFRSFPRGPVAAVAPGALEWFGEPWRAGEGARYPMPAAMPPVAILYACAGFDPGLVEDALARGYRGLVLAGLGSGNAGRALRRTLAQAAARGVAVVRASRVDEGLVDREPDDDANGFVAARALNPAKARILVQLLLANGIADPAAMQRAFQRR